MAKDDDRTTAKSARRSGTETDDRLHPHLPVTAEVGSEGGSYADPTHQVATFEEDLPRTEGRGGHRSVANYALHRDTIPEGGAGTDPDPDGGMIRYPTEPPDPPSATEGWHAGLNWRAGAIGAVAGAATVIGLQLLRRRR